MASIFFPICVHSTAGISVEVAVLHQSFLTGNTLDRKFTFRVVVHWNMSFSGKFLDSTEGCIMCRRPVSYHVSTCQMSDAPSFAKTATCNQH